MFYFVIPDVGEKPEGGLKTIFDYATRLNQLAQSPVAAILAPSQTFLRWLPKEYSDIKILPYNHSVTADDTVLIPEVIPELALRYPLVKEKILLVLNWQYLEYNIRVADLPKLGYSRILTNSEFSSRYVRGLSSLPVFTIPHVIDTKLFCPTMSRSKNSILQRKPNSILILNRKNTHHVAAVMQSLKDLPHEVTFTNNVSAQELSKLYQQHQIFVHLGYPEGFGRPAAEAMASGCIVVGFTGGGGKEYMKDGLNAFTASDGNEKELTYKLNFVLTQLSDKQKVSLSSAARNTITSKYHPANQAKALYRIFRKNLPIAYRLRQIETLFAVKEIVQNRQSSKKISTLPKTTMAQLHKQLFEERQEKERYKTAYTNLSNTSYNRVARIIKHLLARLEKSITLFRDRRFVN